MIGIITSVMIRLGGLEMAMSSASFPLLASMMVQYGERIVIRYLRMSMLSSTTRMVSVLDQNNVDGSILDESPVLPSEMEPESELDMVVPSFENQFSASRTMLCPYARACVDVGSDISSIRSLGRCAMPSGIRAVNVDPCSPFSDSSAVHDSIVREPPCILISSEVRLSPIPVPSCDRPMEATRWKRSMTFGMSSLGIPTPVSWTPNSISVG